MTPAILASHPSVWKSLLLTSRPQPFILGVGVRVGFRAYGQASCRWAQGYGCLGSGAGGQAWRLGISQSPTIASGKLKPGEEGCPGPHKARCKSRLEVVHFCF